MIPLCAISLTVFIVGFGAGYGARAHVSHKNRLHLDSRTSHGRLAVDAHRFRLVAVWPLNPDEARFLFSADFAGPARRGFCAFGQLKCGRRDLFQARQSCKIKRFALGSFFLQRTGFDLQVPTHRVR
jgi:hypothetical protein